MVRRKNTEGFTVIEILIGIALFGLVMPSIIIAVVGVGRLNDRSADLTAANIVAEEKIETLRSQGYNTLTAGTVYFTDELDKSFTEPRSASYTVTNPAQPGTKIIDINITYTDQDKTRNLNYRSIISELGVSQ